MAFDFLFMCPRLKPEPMPELFPREIRSRDTLSHVLRSRQTSGRLSCPRPDGALLQSRPFRRGETPARCDLRYQLSCRARVSRQRTFALARADGCNLRNRSDSRTAPTIRAISSRSSAVRQWLGTILGPLSRRQQGFESPCGTPGVPDKPLSKVLTPRRRFELERPPKPGSPGRTGSRPRRSWARSCAGFASR